VHLFAYEQCRLRLTKHTNFYGDDIFNRRSFWFEYGVALSCSLFLHPVHFCETRWVLNNRLPKFSSYKSTYSLMLSSRYQMINGIYAHISRSFILALASFNYFKNVNYPNFVLSMLAF
jgi:hypothetical protein